MSTRYILLEKDSVGELVPVMPTAGLLTAEVADRNICLFRRQAEMMGGGDRTIWKGTVTVDETPVVQQADPDAPRVNDPLEADIAINKTKSITA